MLLIAECKFTIYKFIDGTDLLDYIFTHKITLPEPTYTGIFIH